MITPMAEEIEYKGFFWLPNKADARLSGTLRFKPNEYAILDLLGTFRLRSAASAFEIPLIVGRCFVSSSEREPFSKEEEITLKNCRFRSISSKLSSYDAEKIFIGIQFEKGDDVKFKEVYVKFSYLHEWVGISGFNVDKIFDENKVEMNYLKPEPIDIAKIGDFDIAICFVPIPSLLQLRLEPYPRRKVHLEQETYIRIESNEDKPYEEYLDLIRKLQHFFCLAVMHPVFPLYVDGGNSSKIIKNKEDKIILLPIRIFDKQLRSQISSREIPVQDMPFIFRCVENKIGDMIKRWVEEYDGFSSVYNPYFGTIYNEQMYLEEQFLALVRAIEGYHRLTHKDKRSHGLTLSRRLDDLITETNEVTKFLFNSEEDRKEFVKKIVITRNQLTNPYKYLKAVDYGLYLPELIVELIEPFLAILMFKRLGFSDYEIKRGLSNHWFWGSKFKD